MKKLVSKYKGYTFYEYLQASDGAFINTNIKFNKNNCYEFNVRHTGNSDNGLRSPLLGSALHSSGFMILYHYLDNRTYAAWVFSTQYGNTAYLSSEQLYDSVIKIDFPNTLVYTDFNSVSNETTIKKIEDSETDILIFTCGAATYSTSDAKLYSLKIKYNDELIRDYIPASNSDGVLGLYDLVNDVFYTNQGAGTFSVGERINIEVDIDSEIKGRWNTKNLAQLIYYDANNNPYGLQNNDFIYDSYKPNKISAKANYTSGGNKFFSAFKVYLKPNTNYVISMSSDSHTYSAATQLYLYSDNLWGNRIASYGLSIATGNKRLITTTDIIEGWYVIGIYNMLTATDYTDILIKDFMIEEGEVATDYVPYIQTAKDIKTKVNGEIKTIKEIKTKVNGEIKTINLDYELAEDVEFSLLSLDEEDNNNSDTNAPDTI